MEMDRDVSWMMVGILSDGPDQYGKDGAVRRSLLGDTFLTDQSKALSSRLLSLPAEILADIVDLLVYDKAALASLAQVNSHCRQLARCCQFAEIHLDYSTRARQLAAAIAREGIEEAAGSKRRFAIGPCVRKVVVASHRQHLAERHTELYLSHFGDNSSSYPDGKRQELREAANKFYIDMRSTTLAAVSSVAMPNLEVLKWADRFSLDKEAFQIFSHSPIQHLCLESVPIDEPWSLQPPLTPTIWPLRCLNLDVRLPICAVGEGEDTATDPTRDPMTTFFQTLFALCADTLEVLIWNHRNYSSRQKVLSFAREGISFSKLRHLRLNNSCLDSSALSSLLVPTLRHLQLHFERSDKVHDRIGTCESFRELESLVIPLLPKDYESCMRLADLLARHKTIQKLGIHEWDDSQGDERHLDSCIIPVLEDDGFRHLRCLSLAWGGGSSEDDLQIHVAHIPDRALRAIGRITSLERLSLSAGHSLGWRCQWLVDHDKLRDHLKGLQKLKMLALVRDTYSVPRPHIHVERYYYFQSIGPQEHIDAEVMTSQTSGSTDADIGIWERAHRYRMLMHAEAYGEILPSLEWMLCGQRPIAIQRNGSSSATGCIALPLTRERDECRTFWKRMFWLTKEDDL